MMQPFAEGKIFSDMVVTLASVVGVSMVCIHCVYLAVSGIGFDYASNFR